MGASPNAELVAEALATVLEAMPLLDEREMSYVGAHHPWATPEWLEGLQAMSRGQPTEDTKLIAQLMQQLQVQQLNIGMLEAERGNSMAVAAAAAPPPPQQQQQHPSPRGPTHVRSGSPRAAPPRSRRCPRSRRMRGSAAPAEQCLHRELQ